MRPAPVTVAVWPPEVGPSDATNATSRSSGAVVVIAGEVNVPLPSTLTVLSTVIGGGMAGVVNVKSPELPAFPYASVPLTR